MQYAVTLVYYATVTIEAESEDEAEVEAQGTDITEVLDKVGDGTVVAIDKE